MELFRHPSGLFYSRQFAEFLRQKQESEASAHPGELLSIEYVRCCEGEEAGGSWLRLAWVSLFSKLAENCLEIGPTRVALHQQTRRGLVNRLLHYDEGRVLVKR